MGSTSSEARAKLSVGISYGLAGGVKHSRKFRKLLLEAGYTSSSLGSADIIIAHSAGCWLIPPQAHPKLVLYVGMPLAVTNPTRTWRRANITSLRHGRLRANTVTRLRNTYYTLRQPGRNRAIVGMSKHAQPVIFPGVPTVFIANRYDPWPQDKSLQLYIHEQPWSFISLPGTHESIWEQSEDCIAIMNHYARLLA